MNNLPEPPMISREYFNIITKEEEKILHNRCYEYLIKNGEGNTNCIEDVIKFVEIPPLLRLIKGLDIQDGITGKSISLKKK
jgi:hypothetical protein